MDYSQSATSVAISELAGEAKTNTGSELDVTEIEGLYCALLTNRMSIGQPGHSGVLGTALDILGSVMNHSCDPNAVIFFEGNELRVRSIRALKGGDEIVHCYTDVQSDVLFRQQRLKDGYYFTCSCGRCREELDRLRQLTSNKEDQMEGIRTTQQQLFALMNETVLEASTHISSIDVGGIVDNAQALADEACPGRTWPDDLEPMPSLWKTLGRIRQAQGEPLQGVKYSLKGCACATRRMGRRWLDDLFELLQVFTRVVVLPETNPVLQDHSFPESTELWDVFHGYLHDVFLLAKKVYGFDTAYAQAIKNWHDKTLSHAEPPLPGTPEFQERFKQSHAKLLSWAGVDNSRWVIGSS